MAKHFFKRHRRTIIRAQAAINALAFVLAVSCMDSESCVPCIVCTITLTWLGCFAYANGYFTKTTNYFYTLDHRRNQ